MTCAATAPPTIDSRTAITLAETVLSMAMITNKGRQARHLARLVLGIATGDNDAGPPNTIGRSPIAADEPTFLIRAQDAVAAQAVRAWAELAAAIGADEATIAFAIKLADEMDAWPKKKIPTITPPNASS
jgi:hypothetical protein